MLCIHIYHYYYLYREMADSVSNLRHQISCCFIWGRYTYILCMDNYFVRPVDWRIEINLGGIDAIATSSLVRARYLFVSP